MSNKCSHFAVAIIKGRPKLCSFGCLSALVEHFAWTYYVGCVLPDSEKVKWLKEFKKFEFCPKCGEKLDFTEVEKGLGI